MEESRAHCILLVVRNHQQLTLPNTQAPLQYRNQRNNDIRERSTGYVLRVVVLLFQFCFTSETHIFQNVKVLFSAGENEPSVQDIVLYSPRALVRQHK